jgi:CheY-like chemotaxis protein
MTMADKRPRILDVGQCDIDHFSIRKLLERNFSAKVDREHNCEDAMEAIRENTYDLVLVNRVFDEDGDLGVNFVREVKQSSDTRHVKVMLVSNYADAQKEAVSAGALPGFGKAKLDDPETITRIREGLGRG